MKKIFFLLVLLVFSTFQLFAHDEKSTKLELKNGTLLVFWNSVSASPDRFQQLQVFLETYNSSYTSIWEYQDHEKRIIQNLRLACLNQNDNSVLENLVEYVTLEKNISEYKNSKLLSLLTIFLVIMITFIFSTIVFALIFYNSHQKQKSTSVINKKIIEIQEAEKIKLSHELHDTVAQELKGISLISHSNEIDNFIQKAISEIRTICYNLTPPEIQNQKLTDAIAVISEDFRKKTQIELPLVIVNPESLNKLDKEKQLNVFRIIQESLENIKIHAKATEASVIIRDENSSIVIVISDDGIGFDTNATKSNKKFGLKNIKERTEILNGIFKIKSKIGFGTDIIIKIPGANS